MRIQTLHLASFAAIAGLAITTASVASGPVCPCATDLNNDGMTDAPDLAILLGAWGTRGLADFNESGTVDAVDLAILLGEWGPCDPPANDNCGQAIVLDGETVVEPICNASATDSPVSFPTMCDGDRATIGKDIWYRWTAPYDGRVIVHTYESEFDTVLGVYGSTIQGSCACPGGQISFATLLGCDDDVSDVNTASFVEVPITEGDCLTLRVGGYKFSGGDVDEGPGLLTVRPIKKGDRCDIAHDLPSQNQVEVNGTNAGDTWLEIDQSSCANGDDRDEWYRFVMPCQGTLHISTCDPFTDYDTTLAAYVGCGGVNDEITCNDDSTTPGCQIGGLNRKSEITVVGGGGDVIYIRVSGFQGAVGNFRLKLSVSCVG
ncbi:MAG: hypothetical protein JNL80_11595 [Phycisphaerae bacterium]|jgi:hypothetical protein|nr:hypothetical protein [Phycisphaerae bacterium]